MNIFAAELAKEVTKVRKAKERKEIAFALKQRRQQDAFMKKQARQARAKRLDTSMLRKEEFYWSDAPKYAQQYYGEVYHETTRHDNEWGDY